MKRRLSYKFKRINRLSILAKLFILVLLIVVFEGAVRKWVSKDFTFALVGLRDGMVTYGIVVALINKYYRFSPRAFQILLLSSLLMLAWGLLQLIINQTSPLIFLLGLRFWLLYLWFAFMAGISIGEYDFIVITKIMLWLLMLMTPLAVVQHFLPPTSFWNKQVDEDSFIFLVTSNVVRTTGTFSFTAGYSTFLMVVSPFVYLSIEDNKKLSNSKWMPSLAILALLIATIVSGARSAIIFFGLLFLIYAFATILFVKGKKKGRSLIIIFSVILLLIASISIFSKAVDATRDRFESANESEKPLDRLVYNFGVTNDLSFFGEGIGMGNNFAALLQTGERKFLLSEAENGRVVSEAGLLGIGFVILKVIVILVGLSKSLRLAKYTGHVWCLLIWATIGLALLSWPIVGQLTINALGYLMFGLGIAAIRVERMRIVSCR